MHFDPILPAVVGTTLIGLLLCLLFRQFKLPLVLAYILTGLIVGPQCLSLINDIDVIETMGTLGVILLLFFIGMEVSPDKLRRSWRVSITSTGL
ncbi:MAG: cation:proton antiporter domain-containing protein, partial [Paraglaciecola chathamensis]